MRNLVNKFCDFIGEHPWKAMFLIQIPISIITSCLTTMLLK